MFPDPLADQLQPGPILELVREVRPVVSARVLRTPVLPSRWLSRVTGRDVHLKCESLQVTGSFKVRGALAALAAMDPAARAHGVVSSSAGNHGAGLAWAAQELDAPCTIVVPRGTPDVKLEKMRGAGARTLRAPHDGYDATQEWTLQNLEELGGTFISPFEHPAVIAGNGGTTALEILEDFPECDTLVVPCGGGGCIVGMGLVAHERRPGLRVVGVNSDASPGMWLSRRDGRAHLSLDSRPTIAEGLEGGVGAHTFRLGQEAIDEMLCVPESSVAPALVDLLHEERLLVEGSAAVAVAALRELPVPGDHLCLLLTGSNIDPQRLRRLLEAG